MFGRALADGASQTYSRRVTMPGPLSASIVVTTALCVLCRVVAASPDNPPGPGDAPLKLDADEIRWNDAARSSSDESLGKHAPVPYGMPGQWWLSVGAGVAAAQTDGDFAADGRLNLTTSTFLVEDFEFLMEWDFWGFMQDGPDAVGLSWSFLLRVHFPLDDERNTTFFLDGGVGVLGSTERVPEDGTFVNLIPKLGFGWSHRLGDSADRLVGGVRWHHISNARISGEESNPSRDGVMFYLGYTFPL